MGATMETQPTQHGLMQIFTSLGLATDNSLTALEGQNPDGKGFASLLSGLLPGDANNTPQSLSSNLLPIHTMDDSGLLGSPELMDESLPLLGQVLPLGVITPALTPAITPAITPALTPGLESAADKASLMAPNGVLIESAVYKGALNPSKVGSTENDPSAQVLEEQGFYAQSLVSSLIGSGAGNRLSNSLGIDEKAAALNNATSIAGESAKFTHVVPQPLGTSTLSQNLTASELDAMSDEASDRFLGAESVLNPLKSKKSAAPELSLTSPNIAPLNTPSAMDSNVSLALALNEDPTTQSLDELIDGEVLEKSELETKSTTLERKQDDQTLKLSKGQQAWGDALMERITMTAAKDLKQVTIHLDPPELGTLELKLQVQDDQKTHVHVQVQNPQVKEALESSAHRLREMLANQGLELAEFDVQTDAGRGEQSSYSSDEQGQGQSQDSDTSEHSAEEISVEIPKTKNNNLLDTFV
jgi:hypothetical protein